MATSDRISSDKVYSGTVQFKGPVTLPAGTVNSDNINSANPIDGNRTVHRHVINYGQKNYTPVIDETRLLHIARAAISIVDVELRIHEPPASGNMSYSVNLQKSSDGSSTWTSILDSVLVVDSGSPAYTKMVADLVSSPALTEGQALRVVVDASGTTGNQGEGFILTCNLDEQPN